MTQLEDLDSLCVSTGYPSGMRPVRLGAERGALGGYGGAWARAPGVARVLFIGFFFSTRSSRIPKSKNRPFFHKKQAGGRKHVLKTKTELTAHVLLSVP
jgi:hypothetical protein